MLLYRIVRLRKRARDLSGTGAFLVGGRWNQEGTYALYTSENPSLAILETLVHMDESEMPPNLFLVTLELDDNAPVHEISSADLPADWRIPDNLLLKNMGDELFQDGRFIGIKVPSAVVPIQFNIVLNPRFDGYYDLIKIVKTEEIAMDQRLR